MCSHEIIRFTKADMEAVTEVICKLNNTLLHSHQLREHIKLNFIKNEIQKLLMKEINENAIGCLHANAFSFDSHTLIQYIFQHAMKLNLKATDLYIFIDIDNPKSKDYDANEIRKIVNIKTAIANS